MQESEARKSISFQDRDFDLLRGLFECRVMTAKHIGTIYFDGRHPYTKKRLQKMKTAGLIAERKRRMNEPSILFLTRKAFILLKKLEKLSDYPSISANSFESRVSVNEFTLRHELQIMDVKAAFHAALAMSEGFEIVDFNTWPLLYEFTVLRPRHGKDYLVKPDGFIRIQEKEFGTKGFMHECFLELDRSSEHQDRLVAHSEAYVEFYKSGDFAMRNGGSRADIKEFPFRVLLVLKSAERRNNTAERLAQNNPPILRQTWLTTFAEVTADPLGPIWILPAGYRDVMKNTPFYKERPNRRFEYHRRPEREAYVESKIKKWRLFETSSHQSITGTSDSHQ